MPLDEIARHPGVSAGTVRRHFPTKEALFEAELMVIVATVAVIGRRAEGAALRRRVLSVIVDGLTAGSPAPATSPLQRGTTRSTR